MQPLKAEDSIYAISKYNNIISDALYSHITIIYLYSLPNRTGNELWQLFPWLDNMYNYFILLLLCMAIVNCSLWPKVYCISTVALQPLFVHFIFLRECSTNLLNLSVCKSQVCVSMWDRDATKLVLVTFLCGLKCIFHSFHKMCQLWRENNIEFLPLTQTFGFLLFLSDLLLSSTCLLPINR